MQRSYILVSRVTNGNPHTTVTYFLGQAVVGSSVRNLRAAAKKLGEKYVATGSIPNYGTTIRKEWR